MKLRNCIFHWELIILNATTGSIRWNRFQSFFLSTHTAAVLRSHSHKGQDRQASTSSSTHTYATARLQKDDAQASSFCWQRVRATCVRQFWKSEMQDASTTCCGKLLYTDMRQKMDLLKSAGCAVISHQCPYNALLWPCPLLPENDL